MSASDMLGISSAKVAAPDPMVTANASSISWREDTDAASIVTSVPSLSGGSTNSDLAPTLATPETTPSSSIYGDASIISSTNSFASPSSTSSHRSWASGFGKMARAVNPFARRRDGESPRIMAASPAALSPAQQSPVSPYIAPSPSSIIPSSAMVSPAAFTVTPAPEVNDMMEDIPLPPHSLPAAMAHPHNMPPALTPDSPNIDNPAEALRRYEWSETQRRQVTEFARLCSQWPQSSYNKSKFAGMPPPSQQYLPQSWANPRHVVRTMQRQSDLERHLCESGGTFHPCTHNHSTRSSSTDEDSSLGSTPSSFGGVSRQSSLATTVSLGPDQDNGLCDAVWAASKKRGPEATEPKTADALRAAMASPMVEAWRGDASIISVSSLTSVASMASADESKPSSAWASLANSTKSLSELDKMAELATTDKMDIDEPELPEPLSSIPSIPGSHPSLLDCDLPAPTRSGSCKRPLTFIADDDDKRRRLAEYMGDDTTMFTDEPAAFVPVSMSASTPSLPSHPSVIGGHMVKTSDTHPLVISPLLPLDVLPQLGKYLIAPTHGREQPVMLGSEIDVPTLLLSHAAVHQCASEAGPVMGSAPPPGPLTLIFYPHRPEGVRQPTQLGNLLLSSCPGKRLRMTGPVKGRGPVSRDLATDMRRIKSTGTDAIVWYVLTLLKERPQLTPPVVSTTRSSASLVSLGSTTVTQRPSVASMSFGENQRLGQRPTTTFPQPGNETKMLTILKACRCLMGSRLSRSSCLTLKCRSSSQSTRFVAPTSLSTAAVCFERIPVSKTLPLTRSRRYWPCWPHRMRVGDQDGLCAATPVAVRCQQYSSAAAASVACHQAQAQVALVDARPHCS